MATDSVKLPDELLAQAQAIAQQEGKTVDELVAEAFDQLIKDRVWKRLQQEAARRRGSMTDEQVQNSVDESIHAYRAETRGR